MSTNDDWASNVIQADAIRATGLAPSNAKEAAILIDLPQVTAGGFHRHREQPQRRDRHRAHRGLRDSLIASLP